jgi:hypothetical protein
LVAIPCEWYLPPDVPSRAVQFFGAPVISIPVVLSSCNVTFVTVPKPQRLPEQIEIAKIVLAVWLTYPFTRIIMYTTLSDYDPTLQLHSFLKANFWLDRVIFAGDLKPGYEHRPLVREWFIQGFRAVPNGYICFLNGDIIIPPLWMNTALAIFDTFRDTKLRETLVYGTRTDVHQNPDILRIPLTGPNFFRNLVNYLEEHVRCNNPFGMDVVFVHSSFNALNWDDLPDFVVGMCVWDNFFMGWANGHCNTVTMDFHPRMFHVDHAANACNDGNYNHFRHVAAHSPHFRGFQEHSSSTWAVTSDMTGLTRHWHLAADSRKFRSPVTDVVSADITCIYDS